MFYISWNVFSVRQKSRKICWKTLQESHVKVVRKLWRPVLLISLNEILKPRNNKVNPVFVKAGQFWQPLVFSVGFILSITNVQITSLALVTTILLPSQSTSCNYRRSAICFNHNNACILSLVDYYEIWWMFWPLIKFYDMFIIRVFVVQYFMTIWNSFFFIIKVRTYIWHCRYCCAAKVRDESIELNCSYQNIELSNHCFYSEVPCHHG